MAVNFNVFDWIRDGVRRSVLLGVSDAVQTMGVPPDAQDSNDQLLDFFREETAPSRRRIAGGTGSPKRKKLGRSLTEIGGSSEKG